MYNNNNNIQGLDILQILAFYVQLKNIKWDEQQSKYIHGIIQNINKQIAKLHNQNDIIMKQNQQILDKLDKIKNLQYNINERGNTTEREIDKT